MSFDVDTIRAAYPALADGYAYLDGAAGTQLPEPVIAAIGAAYRAGLGNAGGAFPASARASAATAACRQAVADLVGGVPDGVILGPNMTTLTYRLAGSLARDWRAGDEVIVSRLDHDANVRPWVQAAARAGATVRWAEVELPAGELPVAQYDSLLSDRTVLVAVTAASNVLGTRPDVAAITARARAAGALSYVDGVHATPHGPTDVVALGADFYATSAYKWSGPHVGAVVADPSLLGKLHPDKLEPAPGTVPDRFERGTPPFADLAGVTAAVEHLAGLDPAAAAMEASTRSRRARAGPARRAAGRPGGHAEGHHVRPAAAPDRDRVLHGGGPEPGRGGRAPGPAEDQRVARAQLRLGTHRRARHPRPWQRGAGRAGPLQQPR